MPPLTEMTCQVLFLGSPLIMVALFGGLCIKYDLLPFLKKPLDMGISWKGVRLFGANKTWRGFGYNMVFCLLGAWSQGLLQQWGAIPPWLRLADYEKDWILLGVLMGLGMTLGELPNSFLKRRLGIPPGMKARGIFGALFMLFDQIDIAIGIWACLYLPLRPSPALVLWSLALAVILHLAVSLLGYLFGMPKTIF